MILRDEDEGDRAMVTTDTPIDTTLDTERRRTQSTKSSVEKAIFPTTGEFPMVENRPTTIVTNTSDVMRLQAASNVSAVDAYIVVFSVADEASFSFASACLQTIQRRSWKTGGQSASVILVANKNDLVRNRIITDYGNTSPEVLGRGKFFRCFLLNCLHNIVSGQLVLLLLKIDDD